jgi:PilZ domain
MRAMSTAWRRLPNRRTFERQNTWVHALLHFEGATQSVVLRNVSREGARLEFAYGLNPGDEIEIELTSARRLQGTVAWSVAAYCGVEFPTLLAEGDPVLGSCKRH